MKYPKISIITISYNSAKTIEKTIKSVIEQDYPNKEYIVIDGNSTDGTQDIIRRYSRHIAYWISEKDKGISDAFNKGIKAATGEVIGIVNSDDEYLPGALSKVAEAYENGIDVYRGSIQVFNFETGETYTYSPSMKFGILPIHVNVCHLPTFITKDAYNRYGYYNVELKLAMDLDLLTRFYRGNAKFKRVNSVLGQFNVGGVSTKVGEKEVIKERKKVILLNGGTIFHIIVYNIWLKLISGIKIMMGMFDKTAYKAIRYNKLSDKSK